jgi:hypothetical protein
MTFIVTYPSGKTWKAEYRAVDFWWAENIGSLDSLHVLQELHAALQHGCIISAEGESDLQ